MSKRKAEKKARECWRWEHADGAIIFVAYDELPATKPLVKGHWVRFVEAPAKEKRK